MRAPSGEKRGIDSSPAGELIQMTAEQREALDVRSAPVESVTDALSPAYPAEVVVPNAQLRVVSAPQAGLPAL